MPRHRARRYRAFQIMVRPLPHPRSSARSPGCNCRNARSMSLRTFDPSSGGATVSWRASVCSAASRYLVCSAIRRRRPQVGVAGRRVERAAAAGARQRRCRAALSAPAQSGQRTTSSRRGEIIARPPPRARPRAVRRGGPTCTAARARATRRQAATRVRRRRATLVIAAASAWTSPAGTSSAVSSSVSTSRIDGRSEATMGRPSAEVLEELQR